MTNLDSILKSKDITLPTKVHLVKAMVFPAVMYGCESWTIKKAEHQRINAFELWCWRRLLRVPWTARRSNQSILKEISPGISLEGMTNLDSILKSRYITLPTKVRPVKATLWFFQWSCMDVKVGLWRKLSTKELMLLNCSFGEDSCESLGLQGEPTTPS